MKKTSFISTLLLSFIFILNSEAAVQKDIPYSSEVHELKTLDIYKPDSNSSGRKLPVLIHIHGGGWKTGDKKIQRKHGDFYSSKDIIFININYRLTPEVQHPSHVNDCAEAVAWVFNNIEQLGGDKNRIFISGHSAGAHLAALLGTDTSYLSKHNIQVSKLAGVIPIDTASFDLLSRRNERFVKKLVDNAFGTDKALLKSASPIHHIMNNQTYPTFLIFASGKRNSAINQSQELSLKLREAGANAQAIVVDNYNHRDMNLGMREIDGPISTEILEFIK
jgi:arylformamidase